MRPVYNFLVLNLCSQREPRRYSQACTRPWRRGFRCLWRSTESDRVPGTSSFRSLTGDSLHLAYASLYKIDFLLTWNCNHLANANKKQHIRVINTRLGLFVPEIATPMELFTETT